MYILQQRQQVALKILRCRNDYTHTRVLYTYNLHFILQKSSYLNQIHSIKKITREDDDDEEEKEINTTITHFVVAHSMSPIEMSMTLQTGCDSSNTSKV